MFFLFRNFAEVKRKDDEKDLYIVAGHVAGNHSFQVSKNLEIFNALYKELDMYYVDSLDADALVGKGIDAMLASLDPYTDYYPEEDIEELKMLTTGKYGGIGSIIRMRSDSTVMIAEPYEGMPAAEVGLHIVTIPI